MVDGGEQWTGRIEVEVLPSEASPSPLTHSLTNLDLSSISSDNIKKGGYFRLYVVCYDRAATYTATEPDQPFDACVLTANLDTAESWLDHASPLINESRGTYRIAHHRYQSRGCLTMSVKLLPSKQLCRLNSGDPASPLTGAGLD
jgi:hypothetical protein